MWAQCQRSMISDDIPLCTLRYGKRTWMSALHFHSSPSCESLEAILLEASSLLVPREVKVRNSVAYMKEQRPIGIPDLQKGLDVL